MPPDGIEGGPLYAFDASWTLERAAAPLAGADEAGRGALAGPLVASAVVLDGVEIPRINDSKSLAATLREELLGEVLARAEALSVVSFPAWWVDRHGMGAANRQALRQAVEMVASSAGCSLADGNLKLGPEIECLPRADGKSAAVAAASVAAKVLRDGALHALSGRHAGYGFERNRGYGTPEHRAALSSLGPCRVHRLSYAGVADAG